MLAAGSSEKYGWAGELVDTPAVASYAARWTIGGCREPLLVEATERVAG